MKNTDLPFNIVITGVTSDKLRTLRPVTSTDILGTGDSEAISSSNNFHPDGLFSTIIFGKVGDPIRDNKFSYIPLNVGILHPVIFDTIVKLNRLYGKIMAGTIYVLWNPEKKDFEISNELEGKTGYNYFIKHFKEIEFKTTESQLRNDNIALVKKYSDVSLTKHVLVIPAGLRDVKQGVGNRLEMDEINDYYRKIIGIANTIKSSNESGESDVLNYSRYQLSLAFNDLYSYIRSILKPEHGKGGLIQGKWIKRRLFNGTRNVISAMRTARKDLNDKNTFSSMDTIMGLFQTLRAFLPVTIHALRTKYLDGIMGTDSSSNTAILVDPVTLRKTVVELNPLTKDMWSTIDGLEKVINSFEEKTERTKVILIEDYYLALVYRDGKRFKVFSDIRDLPEGWDKSKVKPITLVEFLYFSTYQDYKDKGVIVSRYPVGGIDSVYPSTLYVKSTIKDEVLEELDSQWKPLGSHYIATSSPTLNKPAFLESMNVSNLRLTGLGGDFDGDLCSGVSSYSNEGLKNIRSTLASRKAYINASKKLRTSVNTDILSLVLKNMTGLAK